MPMGDCLPVSATCEREEVQNSDHGAFKTFDVLGVPIAALSLPNATEIILHWLETSVRTRIVTFTNVHMVVEGLQSSSFFQLLQGTDMNCPDGAPVAWVGRHSKQPVSRICGPDFLPAFCASTAHLGYRHFFYGGKPGVAEQVASALKRSNPDLQIAGWFSPPFGVMDSAADAHIVQQINESRADIVWVCLGCPKQENWMWAHREHLHSRVLLGVGQAFDVIAGHRKRAPAPIRAIGMEWFFRALCEPRRLGWRYLRTNSVFLYALARNAILRRFLSADRVGQRHKPVRSVHHG